MKISTVIATYNGEKYIVEQLKSIWNQTRTVDEVIIVDDCSSDATINLIKSFITINDLSDSWKIYMNSTNLGYKANFKKALGLSSCDIVILCDQDDIWEEDKVEELEKVFKGSNVLSLNASFRFIDGNGAFINLEESNNNNNLLRKNYKPNELSKIHLENIIMNNISPGCTMAVTRELVELYLKTSTGIQPHDWELNILACLKGGLFFYNKKLTRYRIHGENEIGMTTDLNKVKLTPNLSYERRCHNISERLKLGELFEQLENYGLVNICDKKLFQKLFAYDRLRYKCVVEKRPFVWFLMLGYSVYISKYHYIRFREIIGDFVFSIKR